MKTVGEILRGRKAYSAGVTWPVRHVIEYLGEKRVGAVPIVDGDQVVGVFSERDLLHRIVLPGLDIDSTGVSQVMTKEVIHVAPEQDYLKAKALMLENGVRHLVVKDEDGRLNGFISLRELSETALAEANSLITKLNDSYYGSSGKGEG